MLQIIKKNAFPLLILESIILTIWFFTIQFQKEQLNDCQNQIAYFKAKDRIEFEARVIPNAQEIPQGDTLEADILLVPTSFIVRPKVVMYGHSLYLKEGKVKYKIIPKKLGKQSFNGYVEWVNGNGNSMNSPFKFDYTVVPKCH